MKWDVRLCDRGVPWAYSSVEAEDRSDAVVIWLRTNLYSRDSVIWRGAEVEVRPHDCKATRAMTPEERRPRRYRARVVVEEVE